MELPYRKSREEDDRGLPDEANDVRSSLQGSLREGVIREDAGFLGGGLPPSVSRARQSFPTSQTSKFLILISAALYAVC